MGIPVGLDGTRSGWIAVRGHNRGDLVVEAINNLETVVGRVRSGELGPCVVDVPLGLMEAVPRAADEESRRYLGRRGCTVFPAPYAAMLRAAGLPLRDAQIEASQIRMALDGKRCSIQSAAILPKIEEAHRAIVPELREHIFEDHPEVSFAALNGGSSLLRGKKSRIGRELRRSQLEAVYGDLTAVLEAGRRLGAAADDVLDAAVMLWTAQRLSSERDSLVRLPLVAQPAVVGGFAQIVA